MTALLFRCVDRVMERLWVKSHLLCIAYALVLTQTGGNGIPLSTMPGEAARAPAHHQLECHHREMAPLFLAHSTPSRSQLRYAQCAATKPIPRSILHRKNLPRRLFQTVHAVLNPRMRDIPDFSERLRSLAAQKDLIPSVTVLNKPRSGNVRASPMRTEEHGTSRGGGAAANAETPSLAASDEEVSTMPFKSIRVHVDYAEFERVLEEDQPTLTYWRDDVIPAAIKWLEKAVNVRRVVPDSDGQFMRLERTCQRYWTTGEPIEPWHPEKRCIEFHPSSSACGLSRIPEAHLAKATLCPISFDECEELPPGAGFPRETDLVIYVSADETSGPCATSSSTLGFASYCRQDQYDRPIAGNLNLCTSRGAKRNVSEGATNSSTWRGDVMLVLHEVFHILGVSETAMAFYRNKDLTPRTPRDPNTNDPPTLDSPPYYVASSSTIQSFPNPDDPRYYQPYIVTPACKREAQKIYGCEDSNGIPLENEGSFATRGDHIEKRAAYQDFLSGSIGRFPVVTSLSLAILEDTGWYKPNYFWATEMAWASPAFTDKACQISKGHSCIKDAESLDEDHFCVPEGTATHPPGDDNVFFQATGCTQNLQAYAVCSVTSHTAEPPTQSYFPNLSLGGTVTLMDFCPVYEAFSLANSYPPLASDCTSEANMPSNFDYYGATFGHNSRCLKGYLLAAGYQYNDTKKSQGMCYGVECRGGGETRISSNSDIPIGYNEWDEVVISVRVDPTMEPSKVVCSRQDGIDNKLINVEGMQGYLTCPKVARACFGLPCRNGGFPLHRTCICQPGFAGSYCELTLTRQLLEATPYFAQALGYGTLGSDGASFIVGWSYVILPEALAETNYFGNPGEVLFEIVGDLPNGMAIDEYSGALYGIPTGATTECETFVVRARGIEPYYSSQVEFIAPLRLRVISELDAENYKSAASVSTDMYWSGCSQLAPSSDGELPGGGISTQPVTSTTTTPNPTTTTATSAPTTTSGQATGPTSSVKGRTSLSLLLMQLLCMSVICYNLL